MPSATTTRFAPSPTGHLHLGHAHSALFGWRAARMTGGRFLLRIEDIDSARCRPAFEADLIEDLRWLGISWDGPVRRQSDHLAEHREALAELDGMGLVYPCFCTRKEIAAEIAAAGHAPHGPEGAHYPGTCRHLSAGERAARIAGGDPFALRLDMGRAVARAGALRWYDRARGWQDAVPAVLGDVVLARKDIPISYHLAVVVDDARQGVSLVTRGEDLFAATHLHRLLQALLRLPIPEWHHHRLFTNERGERLAKRDQARSLRALRSAGHAPAEIRDLAGFADVEELIRQQNCAP